MTGIEKYKQSLVLGPLASKFYDFLVDRFAFDEKTTLNHIEQQFFPWFEPQNEQQNRANRSDCFSQYYLEYVHQKYRLALEFAAQEAGFEVLVFDSATLRPVSKGMFWFRGEHPDPVYWMMVEGSRVLAKGGEDPNTLTLHTIDKWLEDRILSFASIKAKHDSVEKS